MRTSELVVAGAFAVGIVAVGCERETGMAGQVSFAADVLPILQASCVECHDVAAEGVVASGLNLSDYGGVMGGTKFGPVVVPNSSESSALYLVVAHKTDPKIHMPPHHPAAMAEGRGTALTEDQIKTIQDWIDQGALHN
ncbi:MAG: hypothetical protein OEO82_11610 [Gammaproteobacteria bacterium]|nr:hypothetical protein [Gammaproteobacteria bacterium]